ncbi:MAG: glycosyl transferase family 1 [Candidatus Rokuibacteriota bacterium]|nr:MAG: glycosyl transferase family 1 [Candidatus Rokubacteria bacterium]
MAHALHHLRAPACFAHRVRSSESSLPACGSSELREDGVQILFVSIDVPFPRGLRWLRRVPFARTLLNEALYVPRLWRLRQVDVVHVFSASYWSFLLAPVPAMLLARLWGKRVVLNYHSGEADDHLARWGRLVHPWLRLAHSIVVPSHYLAEVFERHGYAVRVVPNVVDLGRFFYRDRAEIRPRFLSTRNLEPHYRVDVVIEAFALVRARCPEATLTVVGDGSEKPRLRALAAERGAEGIRFLGAVEPSGMPDVYDGADVFLNASVVDNQPVSVLEAFAAGVPVVSTSTGDLAALVRDGETGVLVPADDPAAMAKAMLHVLELPERARALARAAREDVQRFTWPRVREAWARVYDGTPA